MTATKNPPTIVGAAVARRIMAKDGSTANIAVGNCSITAHLRRAPSGTLVLNLHASDSRGHHAYNTHRRHYIRSASPAQSINRAFSALWLAERAAGPVRAMRESLYLLAESREVPDAWGDMPDRAMPYEAMTPEDVNRLAPLVAALPMKVKAAA